MTKLFSNLKKISQVSSLTEDKKTPFSFTRKHKIIGLICILAVLMAVLIFINIPRFEQVPIWEIRSVDTVKFSRDMASVKKGDEQFDVVIDKQVKNIAELGATHIAIGTPYDAEFVPFLERWVRAARKHNLKVWFRGNFSGWEKWFEYKSIDREEHKKLLAEFILKNSDLFEDGDIFTSCPECENGVVGDPRHNNDLEGHRKFLIEEFQISVKAFGQINKKVYPGFYSMNYDVANLVMDKETTKSLGNTVVIDHYVKDPKKVAQDAKTIAEKSGGKVVIGEFGAPIPDIHGDMTEEEQSRWIKQSLEEVAKVKDVVGLNYWVNVGGSARLWENNGRPRKAVNTLSHFYHMVKYHKTP